MRSLALMEIATCQDRLEFIFHFARLIKFMREKKTFLPVGTVLDLLHAALDL